MDFGTADYLRTHSRAWRLLRADTAPLILHVLGTIFIDDNVRTIAEDDLVKRVDDLLYAVNAGQGDDEGRPAFPRTARAYIDTWADPDQGWLRKFYPEGSQTAHYDATLDVERAHAFVAGLGRRSFIGTQSRLQTIIELLRDIVAATAADPQARLAALRRRREELDAEIAAFDASSPADPVALRDRYQHLAGTARELLSDFRGVEENFRALDRSIRADIAAWQGSKGELLDQVVGERHAIADADQGRSFQAFHHILLSQSRRDELTELLERLVEVDVVDVDKGLAHIHFDWLNAAERTQQTVRLLSEQLRRFLDDKVWIENRRVVELLRSIERSALAVRETKPAVTMEVAAAKPEVSLPFERPLYAVPAATGVDSRPPDAQDADLEWGTLFEQVYVDSARLAATVRRGLRGHDQVRLAELLEAEPVTQGVAEVVGYVSLAEDDFDVVLDESVREAIHIRDADGVERVVRMPRASMVRRRARLGLAP